ncbi:MAG: hypothetical protein GX131_10035, partial [candidate division WS1 bacterium]|nr:hypothetical protein [candidate division WS1 bacterium]
MRSSLSRLTLLTLTALLLVVPAAVADDYVEALKAKVPYYQTMTGPRGAMYEPMA